jgi:hypothetical protein
VKSVKSVFLPCFFALAVVFSGCASAAPRVRTSSTPPSPDVVFLIHGIWPDGSWCTDATTAFESAKFPVVNVEYTTFLAGFMFGFGTDDAADLLVSKIREIEAAHAKTRCTAALRYHAVAYSAGTVVTLKAAWRGVKFASAHFGGSPIPAFSPEIADAVRAKEIAEVVNYWSIFDGVTGWGWGAGNFGYHAYDEAENLAIRNIPLAYHHLAPPFDADLCGTIAREMRARAAGAAPHTCLSAAPPPAAAAPSPLPTPVAAR